MKPPRLLSMTLTGLALSWAGSASAYKPGVLRELADAIKTAAPVSVPAAGSVKVGFSPKGGAEALVLRVIGSTKTNIKALSYSFTSPHVAVTLLRAAKHRVTVSLVANYRNSVTDNRSGKSRTVLSALTEAGHDVRIVSAYPVHHDKMLIVDRQTVKLGSLNYSDAAARVSSRNVLVDWDNPTLAKAYLAYFDRNWRQSEPFRTRY